MKLRAGKGMACAAGDRIFDRRNGLATADGCNQACLDDPICIGHTLSVGRWCFGCKVDKGERRDHDANVGYMKMEKNRN